MLVKHFHEAQAYDAPNHRGVVGLRLQGFEEGGPTEPVGRAIAIPAGRRRGAGLDAVREGLRRHRRRDDGDRRAGARPCFASSTAAPSRRAKCASSSTAPTMSARCWSSFHIRRNREANRNARQAMNAVMKNPLSLFDVAGKVAVITGASGAFGEVAAQVLAGAGAKLVLSAGNAKALEATAGQCREAGAQVATSNLRPSNEANCDAIIARAVGEFGRIDILVVASGKNDVAKINDMTADRFLDVMDANVTQSWLMARAATRQMLAQGGGGKIVLMSSARGLLGHPAGYTAYCASKSAVDGITRALGCELGPTGITVNAIAPTVFRSPLTAWMFEESENAQNVRKGFLARVPKGRLGEPEDLAGPLAVPRLARLRFLHRPYPLCRWRLHGRIRQQHNDLVYSTCKKSSPPQALPLSSLAFGRGRGCCRLDASPHCADGTRRDHRRRTDGARPGAGVRLGRPCGQHHRSGCRVAREREGARCRDACLAGSGCHPRSSASA